MPETGSKPREQTEKQLPWGSFCPKSPPPLTKNINNKRPCFSCLLGGGKKELSGLEKCCFRWLKPSSRQRQNRKPKETSPVPGLAPGSSHRQDKPQQQDLHRECGFSLVFWEWHNPEEPGWTSRWPSVTTDRSFLSPPEQQQILDCGSDFPGSTSSGFPRSSSSHWDFARLFSDRFSDISATQLAPSKQSTGKRKQTQNSH